MTRWRYGDAWEQFPMQMGEVWRVGEQSRVMAWNLMDGLPNFMRAADLLVIDPPWSTGNLKSFYTKAGRSDYQEYTRFLDALFVRIQEIAPTTLYLEMGNQHVEMVYERLPFPIKQRWPVVYYRKNPCWFLRGSHNAADHDFTGMDEARMIGLIAQIEHYQVIGDLCMGRGLVGMAAFKQGKPFVGTELNPRRLACLLQKVAKAGGEVVRDP